MAISCPVDLDTQVLRSEVSTVYSRVAIDLDGGRLQLADIVLDAELGEDIRRNIDLWTG